MAKSKNLTVRIGISIPGPLLSKAKKLAGKADQSLSAWISDCIAEMVDRHKMSIPLTEKQLEKQLKDGLLNFGEFLMVGK
jgi:hypothetical protein